MKKSRLLKSKQTKLIEYFIASSTVRCAANLGEVDKYTTVYYFQHLREIISYQLKKQQLYFFEGGIEDDESYFGGHRKGNREREAKGKLPVFGILKRGGKVFTQVIKRCFFPEFIFYHQRKNST